MKWQYLPNADEPFLAWTHQVEEHANNNATFNTISAEDRSLNLNRCHEFGLSNMLSS